MLLRAPSRRKSPLGEILPLTDQLENAPFEKGAREVKFGAVQMTPGVNVAIRIGVRARTGSSARFFWSTTRPRSAFSASSNGAVAATVTVSDWATTCRGTSDLAAWATVTWR